RGQVDRALDDPARRAGDELVDPAQAAGKLPQGQDADDAGGAEDQACAPRQLHPLRDLAGSRGRGPPVGERGAHFFSAFSRYDGSAMSEEAKSGVAQSLPSACNIVMVGSSVWASIGISSGLEWSMKSWM